MPIGSCCNYLLLLMTILHPQYTTLVSMFKGAALSWDWGLSAYQTIKFLNILHSRFVKECSIKQDLKKYYVAVLWLVMSNCVTNFTYVHTSPLTSPMLQLSTCNLLPTCDVMDMHTHTRRYTRCKAHMWTNAQVHTTKYTTWEAMHSHMHIRSYSYMYQCI